jgi:hypothetical protein
VIDCLLQIYIADEETKFGLGFDEAIELLRRGICNALNHMSHPRPDGYCHQYR